MIRERLSSLPQRRIRRFLAGTLFLLAALQSCDSGNDPTTCIIPYPGSVTLRNAELSLEQPLSAGTEDEALEFPSLRKRVAAFSERIWEITDKREIIDFNHRLEQTDSILSKLVNDARQDVLLSFGK